MNDSYSKTKFNIAIASLNDVGDIRERIYNAYVLFHTLNREDFPNELKDDWDLIISSLTKDVPTNEEATIGSVKNTLKNLNDQECEKLTQLLVDFNGKLNEVDK